MTKKRNEKQQGKRLIFLAIMGYLVMWMISYLVTGSMAAAAVSGSISMATWTSAVGIVGMLYWPVSILLGIMLIVGLIKVFR